jgi:hypothetical protein
VDSFGYTLQQRPTGFATALVPCRWLAKLLFHWCWQLQSCVFRTNSCTGQHPTGKRKYAIHIISGLLVVFDPLCTVSFLKGNGNKNSQSFERTFKTIYKSFLKIFHNLLDSWNIFAENTEQLAEVQLLFFS